MEDTLVAPADVEKAVAEYIKARDLLRDLEKAHKKKCAPLREFQEMRAGLIQKFMDAHKLENLRTKSGTCYTSTGYTASLADAEAFMAFVIRTARYELLDRRANSTAVRDYVQEHNELPTGCTLNALSTVGVRKK